MMPKLSYPIVAVVLDGKEHSESEIISRVRHLVKPEMAVRAYCHRTKIRREWHRGRNSTGKVLPTRQPDPDPEHVNADESVNFVVRENIVDISRPYAARNRKTRPPYLVKTEEGNWKLNPEIREFIMNSKIVTSSIGRAQTNNLRIRGEFL